MFRLPPNESDHPMIGLVARNEELPVAVKLRVAVLHWTIQLFQPDTAVVLLVWLVRSAPNVNGMPSSAPKVVAVWVHLVSLPPTLERLYAVVLPERWSVTLRLGIGLASATLFRSRPWKLIPQ